VFSTISWRRPRCIALVNSETRRQRDLLPVKKGPNVVKFIACAEADTTDAWHRMCMRWASALAFVLILYTNKQELEFKGINVPPISVQFVPRRIEDGISPGPCPAVVKSKRSRANRFSVPKERQRLAHKFFRH